MAAMIQLQERLTAVLGNAALIAGMYGVLYYASYRNAAKLRDEKGEVPKAAAVSGNASGESAPAVPTIMLTPWIKVTLKVPVVLSASFLFSVAAKAISYPRIVPVHSFLKISEELSYAAGIALFSASAYLHYVSVRYMVNIRTPVEHGYQVKTACTKGPFAYFKHPTYVAMSGCSLSTVLTFDSAWCLISPILLSVYLFGILGPREEKYMKDYFGADYVKYTRR